MSVDKRFSKQNIERGLHYLKRNGFKQAFFKAKERIDRDIQEENYEEWLQNNLPTQAELEQQRMHVFPHRYKISILVPAYETNLVFLKEMILSVMGQSYDNWELCIADGSESDRVKNCVMDMVGKCADLCCNSKIKYQKLDKNYGISVNSNKALEMSTGDYVGLLDHDDLLTKDALYEIVKALQDGVQIVNGIRENKILALYSDEDKINQDGSEYFDYHRKPDFNPDLLRTNNYICHFFVVERNIAVKVGGFRTEYNGAQDHDFIFRCIESASKSQIIHINKVLYHWRAHELSTADNPESKLYAYEAGKHAIEAHLERMGLEGEVIYTPHLGFFRVKYKQAEGRVMTITKKMWDAMNSADIALLSEEYIMILNSNLRPLTPNWQAELLSHLVRSEVGAVGGKLYTRKNTIESAGYSKNEDGKLIPNFRGMNRYYSGYMHRACLQQEVDGLSLDCMMIKKSALNLTNEKPGMLKEYIAVFDPYVEFKRK
ncbi:MAG: glycosyltransferase [Clostridia bacterium]|nr:glycosyltransferase [Clostridia bacterium]